MKKLLLLMNPCSGKKKANPLLPDIISILNTAGYEVTVYVTAARTDATGITAQRGGEFDLIVCIGGDGTFNEVVCGLCSLNPKPPVAYIPAGSTNDFASSLQISRDILTATRDITLGKPHLLDIGLFNERYFSYIASFGAFTRTSYATPQSLKNLLGHTAYLLSGIKEIASIRTHHLRFTTAEGQVYEDDYLFGAISNSTSVAGILTLDPKLVDMNDGRFELLLVRKPHSPLELSDCILSLKTQDYHSPMLTLISTPSVEIEAPEDMDWTLDGEHEPGRPHCSVRNLHSSVEIILNS